MLVEMGSNAFTGVVLISLPTIYCSKIPECMSKIKITLRKLIDRLRLRHLDRVREICLLERMEKHDIVYLTACKMVDFKTSLLLSSFGSLFTYGLLVLNLQ
ncbi:uncharacterized protein CDAR_126231 [Caerostris darwini]|uniref:Gustatory receptor n=1 Tax=Caerostris darwini TaxID=1538125 RepID=A0AAV4R740_9ARAC|nr:uncharacterized protein CDAR_126231 [Caerostris darwini]